MNNIFSSHTSAALYCGAGLTSPVQVDHNLFHDSGVWQSGETQMGLEKLNAASWASGNIEGDPRFVDATGDPLDLTPGYASDAIDRGTAGSFAIDFLGQARPVDLTYYGNVEGWDIGAIERQDLPESPLNALTPTMTPEPLWTTGTANSIAWTDVADATTYTVQCCETGAFSGGEMEHELGSCAETFSSLADGQTYWFRVQAFDAFGGVTAWSAATSSTQDAAPPTGTLLINAGADATTVTAVALTLTASDPGTHPSGLAEMRIRNAEVAWPATWNPFLHTQSWTLSTNLGLKTIEVELRDTAGNVSLLPLRDSIMLIAPPPTEPAGATGEVWLLYD